MLVFLTFIRLFIFSELTSMRVIKIKIKNGKIIIVERDAINPRRGGKRVLPV